MEGWSDFYTLIGSTAATLIGLIFVVISLGATTPKKATNTDCGLASPPRSSTSRPYFFPLSP
jgi:hypothetical protein